MRYDQLFAKLFCSPLCLETGARAAFERVLLSYMAGTPIELPKGDIHPQFAARKMDAGRADRYADQLLEIDGDTAVIHIDGAIDRNLSAWDRLCFDATDLNDVNRAISRVQSDASVKNVLLAINSPGGTVSGVPETAGQIAALAEKKNVFAFIDGMGCSAAYWLACGCDQIFSTGSSLVGSIGVYLALLDASRWYEDQGLKMETVKDGTLKAAGANWKPLSEAEREHFQEMVSQIGTLFRGDVTNKRPDVSADTMQGQAFFGKAALDAKLVDGLLPNMAAALAQF